VRFVVCYDIADDRRRERVATALLDFGRRVQESVFVATLDEDLFGRMWERLSKLVEEMEDTVHIFPLCATCEGKVRRLGCAELPEDRSYYIV
jgi:CRISPR-associated protein Cas2